WLGEPPGARGRSPGGELVHVVNFWSARRSTEHPSHDRSFGDGFRSGRRPLPHVFVVVMENRSYSQALTMPYVSELAGRYAAATNYHAVAHPSLPNYLALTSGSTFGITDDGYHRLPAGGIGAQLTAHRISWRAYMEGMAQGCLTNTSGYAVKHD